MTITQARNQIDSGVLAIKRHERSSVAVAA